MCLRMCVRRLCLCVRRGRPVSLSHPRRQPHAPARPEPGLHAYLRQRAPGERARLHLRVEADGSGTLVVNANRIVHLNPTATAMAWLMLEETPENDALARLASAYRVPRRRLRADWREVQSQLEQLADPNGACPIHDLNLEILQPFSHVPSAPYRIDLALTYRCNDNCAHCYNARPRAYPELDTATWKQIIDRVREVGVPHVCFTGGEATLRDDLPALVSHAQDLGLVTGLLTNGRLLCDRSYVEKLTDAGLDHVQITLESQDETTHDRMVAAQGAWRQTVAGLRNCLQSRLYVMTNTTLLAENSGQMEATLDFLAELGVPTVGLNALIYAGRGASVGTGLREAELVPLMSLARRKTEQAGQRLIWYTPTQYCRFDPTQMELGVKGCTAALYNLCVEPDGAVIPCQSYYEPLGNILHDPWKSIWEHDLARSLRERRHVPDACRHCAILPECGGGCPLSLRHQSPRRVVSELSVA
jgi:radical SAM protein with 4Fe4S-binding SPASM domain